MTIIVYKSPIPELAVYFVSSHNIGRCFNLTVYKVVSKFKLNNDRINSLRDVNIIGYGQTWCVKSKCDGTEFPAGSVFCPAVEVDQQGNIINENPINVYSGKPYKPFEQNYYEYIIHDECDSGD